jgi:hypothetical protein
VTAGGRDVRATEDSEGLTELCEGTRWGQTRLEAAPPFLRYLDSRNALTRELKKERVQLLHRASITLTLVARWLIKRPPPFGLNLIFSSAGHCESLPPTHRLRSSQSNQLIQSNIPLQRQKQHADPCRCVRRRNVHVLHRGAREPAPGVVVESVRVCLRMDRISHSSELGPTRARAIIIRPTPRQRPQQLPPPLLFYMSSLRLLSRPRRSRLSDCFPPTYTYTRSCPDLCSHIKET